MSYNLINKIMELKYFEDVGSRTSASRVSVNRYAIWAFSSGAIKKHKLNDYKFVRMLSDDEKKIVGFEFTNDNSKPCYKTRKTKIGALYLSTRSFFKHNNTMPTITETYNIYETTINDNVKILYIDRTAAISKEKS